MVEHRQAQRRGRLLGGVRPTGEDHRATPFELFFDLVYVFAMTQVTGYMAHQHSYPLSVTVPRRRPATLTGDQRR